MNSLHAEIPYGSIELQIFGGLAEQPEVNPPTMQNRQCPGTGPR